MLMEWDVAQINVILGNFNHLGNFSVDRTVHTAATGK